MLLNDFSFNEKKKNAILEILKLKGLGTEMPMLSLPFLDWFSSFDFKEFNFVEFGSGYSTNYFNQFVKTMTSYESDNEFYDFIHNSVNKDIKHILIDKKDLINGNFEIEKNSNLIVMIDCDFNRYHTVVNVLNKHKPEIIIFDNSEWYPDACSFISNDGYNEIPFWGIRPESDYDKCTSVFLKHGFNMPLKDQGFYPPGTLNTKAPSETIPIDLLNMIY